jgi:hypothetical protein
MPRLNTRGASITIRVPPFGAHNARNIAERYRGYKMAHERTLSRIVASTPRFAFKLKGRAVFWSGVAHALQAPSDDGVDAAAAEVWLLLKKRRSHMETALHYDAMASSMLFTARVASGGGRGPVA